MSKILGTRIEESIYKMFKQLPGSISGNLRKAAIMYLNVHSNNDVNQCKPIVRANKPLRPYDDIINEIDELLTAYYGD